MWRIADLKSVYLIPFVCVSFDFSCIRGITSTYDRYNIFKSDHFET